MRMSRSSPVGAYRLLGLGTVPRGERPGRPDQREAIEAHLTVVFAALALARHLQDTTGVTIKKLVRTLKPLHTVTIDINGHHFTAETTPEADAADILGKLPPITE